MNLTYKTIGKLTEITVPYVQSNGTIGESKFAIDGKYTTNTQDAYKVYDGDDTTYFEKQTDGYAALGVEFYFSNPVWIPQITINFVPGTYNDGRITWSANNDGGTTYSSILNSAEGSGVVQDTTIMNKDTCNIGFTPFRPRFFKYYHFSIFNQLNKHTSIYSISFNEIYEQSKYLVKPDQTFIKL